MHLGFGRVFKLYTSLVWRNRWALPIFMMCANFKIFPWLYHFHTQYKIPLRIRCTMPLVSAFITQNFFTLRQRFLMIICTGCVALRQEFSSRPCGSDDKSINTLYHTSNIKFLDFCWSKAHTPKRHRAVISYVFWARFRKIGEFQTSRSGPTCTPPAEGMNQILAEAALKVDAYTCLCRAILHPEFIFLSHDFRRDTVSGGHLPLRSNMGPLPELGRDDRDWLPQSVPSRLDVSTVYHLSKRQVGWELLWVLVKLPAGCLVCMALQTHAQRLTTPSQKISDHCSCIRALFNNMHIVINPVLGYVVHVEW